MKKKLYLFLFLAALFTSTSVFAQDITTGLQLHYTFENVTGTNVPDASGHNLAATLMGAATLAEGKNGQAVIMTENTDFVQLPNGFASTLTDYTVSCWVKLNTIVYWGRIFDFGSGTGTNMFLAPQDGSPYYAIKPDDATGEQSVKATSFIEANKWQHVAVTCKFDAASGMGVLKIYINGELAGEKDSVTTTPSALGSTTQNYIGKSQYDDPSINGKIDDFRVYSRALTAEDIAEMTSIPVALKTAYDALGFGDLDLTKVENNLTLPTIANDGVTISWESTDTATISTLGIVTRPEKFKVGVTLTAKLTITIGGVTSMIEKVFNIIVLPLSDPSEIVALWDFSDGTITTAEDGTITVKEESPNGFVATCLGGAQMVTIGKEQLFNVLSIGESGQYFDFGTSIGEAIYGLTDYTVSIYYRKDSTGGLTQFTGFGQPLFGFSNTLLMGSEAIGGLYFEPLRGRLVNTPDNFGAEGTNNVGVGEGVVPVGTWHNITYSQTAGVGVLYIDGVQSATGAMKAPAITLKKPGKTGTIYNSIGRPFYSGDPWLTNTMIYGFRLYSVGLSVDDLADVLNIQNTINDLNSAFAATDYDVVLYVKLKALLEKAKTAALSNYTPAMTAFNAAINAGQAAYDGKTPTTEGNAALQAAIDAYNLAIVPWNELGLLLKTTPATVALGFPGLPELNIAIAAAQAAYDAPLVTNETIVTLKAAIATYMKTQPASASSPLDYTWAITNPSFEQGNGGVLDTTSFRDGNPNGNGSYQYPKGWTLYLNHSSNCNAVHITNAPSDGARAFETWAGTINEFNVYQDIDLPAGKYILSAQMRTNAGAPYSQHIHAITAEGVTVDSSPLDAAKVITGSGWNSLNNWQTMYVKFSTAGGKTRVAFHANGFMQFDNMRLAYYGPDSPAKANFTSKIINPGFEGAQTAGVDSTSIKAKGGNFYTPEGWNAYCNIDTTSGWANVTRFTDAASVSEGTRAFETWSENGKIKEFRLTQKVTAPASGYYKLTADLRCDGSSPSPVDTIIKYDGRLFVKVDNFANKYSTKLGEQQGLITGPGWNAKTAWRTLSVVFEAGVGELISFGAVSSSFMQMDNFTLTYYATADPNSIPPVKKVGYYTLQKTMDAAAATVQNDPIYRMLAVDPALEVTLNVVTDNTAASPVDMTPYDVVIVQESFGGGDKILTPAGPLALAKFTKPTLFNKSYAYKTGRALTAGGSATGAETEGVFTITVDATKQSNQLFNGITFTGDQAALFTIGATDAGSGDGTKNKALNFATGVTGVDGTLLAAPTGSTPSISFNDIPAGTTIGDQLTQARIITFGMNFGAMCRENGINITNENYTLWRNAVYILAGLEVPTTLVGTKNVSVAPAFEVYPNPATNYINIKGLNEMSTVRVFNAIGQQVMSVKADSDVMSIDVTRYSQGIYLLQVESNGKAVTSKFIKK